MRQGEAAAKGWISPTTITWFISLGFAAFGFWYGIDRRDSEAVQSLDRRVTTIEAKMEERNHRRDEQINELRDQLRAIQAPR